MIAITALEGGIDLQAADTAHVGPSMLYDSYTGICALRDIDTRPEGLTQDERLEASRALAMAMFDKGRVELTSDEVTAAIAGLPSIKRRVETGVEGSPISIEQVLTDIRVCSFLSFSTSDNSFRFQHKSFFEFFVAQHVMLERLRDYAYFGKIENAPFTSEILYFLGSFARDQTELRAVVLAGATARPKAGSTVALCRKIVFAAGTLLDNIDLVEGEISNVEVRNLRIAHCRADRVKFHAAAFEALECLHWDWRSCELTGAKWSSLMLDQSNFDLRLNHQTEFNELFATDCEIRLDGGDWVLRHSTFSRGSLSLGGNASLVDVRIDECDSVLLNDLALRSGSRLRIIDSVVRSNNSRWCAAKSKIVLHRCRLAGLWIPSLTLGEIVSGGIKTEEKVELQNCSGIIFSDADPADFGEERTQRFLSQYPQISVIDEPAIRRALRRRSGETVGQGEFAEVMNLDRRKKLLEQMIKSDDSKLLPARLAIEQWRLTEELRELYDELTSISLAL